jgi:long-chain-fatty-acid---luciferin-component ligase
VNPDSIKNYESMLYIPLIPSDFFKELSLSDNPEDIQKIASVPKEQIVTYFTTSGSTGKPSKYPFDRESLERVIKSPKKIFTNVVDIKEDDYILMLSPPPDKSSTGLVQGMYRCMKSMLKTDEQIGFGIKGGALDEEYIINMIYAAKGRRRHLYGPPFIYNSLSDYILQKGHEVKLDKGSNVLITGGWKRVQGEINKAELYEKIGRAFGIDQKNIRDGLGLTDIFSILMECKDHNKHVPPWMYVSIRNTTDLAKEAELGEPGLISFMNPLIQSYPPFIITGDMGRKTYEEKCSCGMIGPTIEYLRRADGLAARGCAIVLDAAINAMRTTK